MHHARQARGTSQSHVILKLRSDGGLCHEGWRAKTADAQKEYPQQSTTHQGGTPAERSSLRLRQSAPRRTRLQHECITQMPLVCPVCQMTSQHDSCTKISSCTHNKVHARGCADDIAELADPQLENGGFELWLHVCTRTPTTPVMVCITR